MLVYWREEQDKQRKSEEEIMDTLCAALRDVQRMDILNDVQQYKGSINAPIAVGLHRHFVQW